MTSQLYKPHRLELITINALYKDMSKDLRGHETHPLLAKRHFPIRPWAFRIGIMLLSFSALGYVKFKLFQKNQIEKRPSVTVPASRARD